MVTLCLKQTELMRNMQHVKQGANEVVLPAAMVSYGMACQRTPAAAKLQHAAARSNASLHQHSVVERRECIYLQGLLLAEKAWSEVQMSVQTSFQCFEPCTQSTKLSLPHFCPPVNR